MLADEVNYCPRCGAKLTQAERFGRLRPVCPACDWIYFADPKVAVAVLLEQGTKILMVRRAVDPARGLWTLPAGFVDAGENPERAAERELFEETGLQARVTELLDVMYGQEHPRGAHIVIFYRAELLSGTLRADDDVDRVAFFSRNDLPPLAFSTTQRILQKVSQQ
ncbi:MAG: NUDIX hydrolase [Anaerolineales bacterium]|jgi:8-oxo-dGTP diphosphatase